MKSLQTSPLLESALTLWARFASPEVEARFRSHQRTQEIRQVNFAMLLSMVGTLPFVPMDYHLFGFVARFWMLLGLRIAFLLFSAAVMALYRMERFAPYADRLLASWGLISGLGILMVGYTRPAAGIVGFLLSVLTPLLLCYFVVPLPLAWQFTLCMIGLAGDLHIVWLRHAALDPLAQRAIVINYVMANVMGVAVAWHLHRLRRQQYAALQREIGLRSVLEAAMSQVKTLQGFLPICMHCKSVRNDEGYWQQVEVYVRENSMAEFTHGICPNCVREHFGEALVAKAG
jgi:hypothetical protein